MNNLSNTIWLFNGEGSRFASGVFTSIENAEEWINDHKVTGILTEYPLNKGVLDWAIEKDLFEIKTDKHREPKFIQSFTSASQEHFHYENGERQ